MSKTLSTFLILAAPLLATTPLVAASPIAEVVCATRAQMVDRMTYQYGATAVGRGIRSREAYMEVWASELGDWTLLMSYVDGRSCIVAMGEDWDDLTPAAPEDVALSADQ